MVFPSTRVGTKAVQAVEVTSQPSAGITNAKRSHTFTFCLEHVTQGPYKVHGTLSLLVQTFTVMFTVVGSCYAFASASAQSC